MPILIFFSKGYSTGTKQYPIGLPSVGEKPPYDLLICDKTKRIEEI